MTRPAGAGGYSASSAAELRRVESLLGDLPRSPKAIGAARGLTSRGQSNSLVGSLNLHDWCIAPSIRSPSATAISLLPLDSPPPLGNSTALFLSGVSPSLERKIDSESLELSAKPRISSIDV